MPAAATVAGGADTHTYTHTQALGHTHRRTLTGDVDGELETAAAPPAKFNSIRARNWIVAITSAFPNANTNAKPNQRRIEMSMSMRSTAAAPLSALALASSSSSSSLRLLLFPSSLSTGPLDTATWPELRARYVSSPAPPPFSASISSPLLLESLSRFTCTLHSLFYLFSLFVARFLCEK